MVKVTYTEETSEFRLVFWWRGFFEDLIVDLANFQGSWSNDVSEIFHIISEEDTFADLQFDSSLLEGG